MASYDQYKQMFMTYTPLKDNTFLHFLCGSCAGFTATIIGSPADTVKTRLMANPDSYKGVLNCFARMTKEEGILSFYKGFIPNGTRLSIWSISAFITMEKLRHMMLGPQGQAKKE